MTKGVMAILVHVHKRKVITTLLLLYTNIAAMTSHANQELCTHCCWEAMRMQESPMISKRIQLVEKHWIELSLSKVTILFIATKVQNKKFKITIQQSGR